VPAAACSSSWRSFQVCWAPPGAGKPSSRATGCSSSCGRCWTCGRQWGRWTMGRASMWYGAMPKQLSPVGCFVSRYVNNARSKILTKVCPFFHPVAVTKKVIYENFEGLWLFYETMGISFLVEFKVFSQPACYDSSTCSQAVSLAAAAKTMEWEPVALSGIPQELKKSPVLLHTLTCPRHW
jgi:hypothetical protein